ncbi:hypothetical protein [Schaalia canis]|uniref:hypothetical protein n=1 Tax=Schaalia canis TaxID=100469 RepID=UPI001403B8BD|nr:hypothetical protein [Schaalia canis]
MGLGWVSDDAAAREVLEVDRRSLDEVTADASGACSRASASEGFSGVPEGRAWVDPLRLRRAEVAWGEAGTPRRRGL